MNLSTIQETTWFERLLLNLLSYSLILVPIAFTVVTIRYRFCPTTLHSNPLLQKFVYGSDQTISSDNKSSNIGPKDDADLSLLENDERPRDIRSSLQKSWGYSRTIVFLWCLLGLQISYLIWGLLQEKIMTTRYTVTNGTSSIQQPPETTDLHYNIYNTTSDDKIYIIFHDSQFLVFFNRIVAFITAMIGLIYIHIRTNQQRRQRYYSSGEYIASLNMCTDTNLKRPAPLYKFVYCSLSNILSSWCQYEALKYVNFPTQCLSKSCKVIPVMLMSRMVFKKRYKIVDYLCAITLAFGTFLFILNQQVPKSIPSSSIRSNADLNQTVTSTFGRESSQIEITLSTNDGFTTMHSGSAKGTTLISGVILLMLYLTFDSFTSNWQQSLYDTYSISNWQMMAAINFYSILLTLTSLHHLGNLGPAILLLRRSTALLYDCLLMSVMSSVGQMFVYFTIKQFGPVVFAVIMTLRQFLSILLSCLHYGHQLNLGSIIGLIIVFIVAGYQVWTKRRSRSSKSNNNRTTIGGALLNFTSRSSEIRTNRS